MTKYDEKYQKEKAVRCKECGYIMDKLEMKQSNKLDAFSPLKGLCQFCASFREWELNNG